MDRSNYKRLGDYIRSVDVRNRDLAVTNLLGVSISKTFIPSIANTIGTDMSTYKVVEPYQFAYGPVTSRNGDKITFALYKGAEKCIISQAYETFEIIDKQKLDPDYLMMWVLRPEFDRYARFKSNGSAREIFSWDEMCEVYLPVPDIAIQRRIVAEYQAVEKRIATNKKQVSIIEETAASIFENYFSFAYNNPGGSGLIETTIGQCVEYNDANLSTKNLPSSILYLETGGVTNNVFEDLLEINLLTEDLPSRAKRIVREGDIIYSTVRPNLKHYGIVGSIEENTVVSTGFVVLRSVVPNVSNELLYLWITFDKYTEYLNGVASASKATYPSITADDILNLKIWVPEVGDERYGEVQKHIQSLYNLIRLKNKENQLLKRSLNDIAAKLLLH